MAVVLKVVDINPKGELEYPGIYYSNKPMISVCKVTTLNYKCIKLYILIFINIY